MENAQTLASHNWKEIPPCYLQLEADDSFRIPVIDMSKLLDQQDPISYRDELARLRSACQDWGFFQLINHGVPEEVVEKMKNDTQEFFMLPLEKKQAYAQLPNNIEGYWLAFVPEEQKLDLVDTLFLIPRPVSERNMRFWPMHPASFRESIDKYSWEMQKVTICLLNFMSTNLGVNSEALTSAFEDGRQSIRLNFYPPCVEADNVKGFPHSDASGLSLLVQVNDVRGLQIKKNGKWLPVKPIPGAFIVNIGDMIEMMSNGENKSIEHRVVMNSERPRLSIAVFQCPNMKTMVSPLTDLVKENGAKYKSIRYEDYLRMVHQASKLDGKSLIDNMKLAP